MKKRSFISTISFSLVCLTSTIHCGTFANSTLEDRVTALEKTVAELRKSSSGAPNALGPYTPPPMQAPQPPVQQPQPYYYPPSQPTTGPQPYGYPPAAPQGGPPYPMPQAAPQYPMPTAPQYRPPAPPPALTYPPIQNRP